jgi:hypothetical protein
MPERRQPADQAREDPVDLMVGGVFYSTAWFTPHRGTQEDDGAMVTSTDESAPADAAEAKPGTRSWLTKVEPAHLILVIAIVGVLAMSVGSITDIDSYWHVLIGREILATHHFSNLGTSWALYSPPHSWITSQWLAEVSMAKAQQWFGWSGLLWWRLFFTLALIAVSVWALLRRARPMVGALIFLVSFVPIVGGLQERPLLIAFVFCAWLGAVASDALYDRPLPPWWAFGLLTFAWAQVHGMWVLAPGVVVLIALGHWADLGRAAWPKLKNYAVLGAVGVVAGCLSPVGVKGLILPLTFTHSTNAISEWQPTSLWDAGYTSLLVLLVILIWSWSRRRDQTPRVVLIFVLVMYVFSLTAARNVIPVLLLVGPFTAIYLSRALGPRRAKTTAREGAILVGLCVLVAALGLGYVIARYATTDPLQNTKPLAIAEHLQTLPGDKRILNSYNASGVLAAFGGQGVQLAIDGRSDRYGNDYIDKYIQMQDLQGDWQPFFRWVNPNYAVLTTQSPMALYLTEVQHWSTEQTANGYSLLKPPVGWKLDDLGTDGTQSVSASDGTSSSGS